MTYKNLINRVILSLMMVFLLHAMVACSPNDNKKDQIKQNPVVDKEVEEETEEETIETKLENEILQILGFSEEKDKIERYGFDDDGSDDQSVHVNEDDGNLELFLSISKESTGIDSAGDGPMVGIVIDHDLEREKQSISKLEDITKELIKAISKYEYVDWIGITNYLPLEDENSYDPKALTIDVERKTLDKINWDTFDTDKLESIVDNYSIADDLK